MAKTVTQVIYATQTWVAPPGTTSVYAEMYAGGGGGSTRTTSGQSAGGGGGAYAADTVTVTPGSSYTVTIGGGGGAGSAGGDSSFASSVIAKGGSGVSSNNNSGGTGGSASGSTGSVKRDGGNGGSGASSTGGGGGEGASAVANGNNASGTSGGTGGLGGDGANGSGNNANGNSGAGLSDTNTMYVTPTVGGGGSGTSRSSGTRTGGSGAAGGARLTFNVTGTGPYVTSASGTYINAGSSPGLPQPADVIAGDLIFIFSTLIPSGMNTPSGFTQIDSSNGGWAGYKVATGSESWPYAVSAGGSCYGSVDLMVVRGADTTSPIGASAATSGSGTSISFTTITPAAVNSLIIQWCGSVTSGTSTGQSFSAFAMSTSNPTWIIMTNGYQPAGVSAASGAWAQRSAATATGGGSATSNNSIPWYSIAIAVTPLLTGPAGVKEWDGVNQR